MTTQIEVVGVKEALAKLNTLNKTVRREITKDYAKIAKPMVDDAKSMLPKDAPMSGWTRSWSPRSAGRDILPWQPVGELKQVKAFTSGKKRNAAIFGMRWNSRTAALFDISGKATTPQGEQMVTTLGARYGSPSRIMWKAYERSADNVQKELEQLLDKIMKSYSEALGYRTALIARAEARTIRG
jgi:hypothetical protein